MLKQTAVLILILSLLVQPVLAQSKHSDWSDSDDSLSPSTAAPPSTPQSWSDDSLKRNAALLSLYEKISLLELDVFDKSTPHEPVAARLSSLEASVFGDSKATSDAPDASNPNTVDRVNRLLSTLKPSDALAKMVVVKSTSSPGWSFKSVRAPWVSTSSQLVSALELQLDGKIKDDNPLVDRISALEKLVLSGGQLQPGADIYHRIDALVTAVPVTDKTIQKFQNKNSSFFNPPPIHWLGSVGRDAKNMGRGVENTTRSVASSPTFWMLLLGAGAITGLVLLERNHPGIGFGGGMPNYVVAENACIGMINCTHCSSCRYCNYCNSGMYQRACGVRIRILQYGY